VIDDISQPAESPIADPLRPKTDSYKPSSRPTKLVMHYQTRS